MLRTIGEGERAAKPYTELEATLCQRVLFDGDGAITQDAPDDTFVFILELLFSHVQGLIVLEPGEELSRGANERALAPGVGPLTSPIDNVQIVSGHAFLLEFDVRYFNVSILHTL